MPSERKHAHGMVIEVATRFAAERSAPMRGLWFFAYTITITNVGDEPARLLRRRWVITDAEGRVEHVEGDGVVGETPRLAPGEQFSYTSGCPLRTPFGSMSGTYAMVRDDGRAFDADVPEFRLLQPHALN